MLRAGFCTCTLAEGVENLYVEVRLTDTEGHWASVEVKDRHNHITQICKDGDILFSDGALQQDSEQAGDKSLLTVKNILEFADTVRFADIEEIIGRQVECNTAISQEGLKGSYGAQTGRVLLETGSADLHTRAKAAAAAGSDARMSGCPLPVVINSGSGNQGITITMPLVEYAKAYSIGKERLYRSLAAANLIAIHQKKVYWKSIRLLWSGQCSLWSRGWDCLYAWWVI